MNVDSHGIDAFNAHRIANSAPKYLQRDEKRNVDYIGKIADVERARKVAQDFESYFLSQMLQPMFEGLDVEEPFGGGHSEKMWRAMQVDEFGKSLAQNGGIGVADMVMREILKAQEASS